MFKKLLSNLPFNPSLIEQVSFYTRRLKRESSIRRTGLVFMVLTMVVQMLAVISPAQPSLASSSNDIIEGGFTSREQAVSRCNTPGSDFSKILEYYRVNCSILGNSETINIRSTDNGNALTSLGRNQQGQTIQRTGKPTGEYTVPINNTTYYMKNLWAWDSGSYSTYKVLRMTNLDGKPIMIMYDCGNIVTIGRYEYTPPPPPLPPPPPPVTPPFSIPKPPPRPIDVCPNIPDTQTSISQCDVCPNVPLTQSNASECYPCPGAVNNSSQTACVTFNKTARNETQNIANANGTTAAGGDLITYTLSVKNSGTQAIRDFVIQENLSDVLQYADVVDASGATLNENKLATWPKTTIAANSTVTKTIKVRIKNPIPETPVSASDRGSFDLVMTNVFYDKAVNIKLLPPITKTVETVTTTLPETGPGTSLVIGFGITVIIAYFFARSRLFATELDLVREEYAGSAGA